MTDAERIWKAVRTTVTVQDHAWDRADGRQLWQVMSDRMAIQLIDLALDEERRMAMMRMMNPSHRSLEG